MLRKIWAIARNDIYLAFRTPIVLVMAFIMPVILTAVLGFAITDDSSTGDDGAIDTRTPLLLIDEDGGATAREVAERLAQSDMLRPYEGEELPATREAALTVLDRYNRLLVLPSGFSQTIGAGEPSTAQLYVNSVDQEAIALAQAVNLVLEQAASLVQVADTATAQALEIGVIDENERDGYFASSLATARARVATAPGVTSELAVSGADTFTREGDTRAGGAATIASGTDQSSPGQLVMFAMITILSSAIALVSERNYGTLRRLVVSPLSRITLLGGKTLAPLLIGLIQMAVMILVGRFLFGVAWGRSPLALLLMVLAFDLAIVGLAILLSTLVRTEDQAVGAMVGFSNVAAAVGGAWWPLEIMPETMQRVGYFFPTAWAMQGFKAVILRGAGVEAVVTPVLALLGFAAVFFALGIWRFRYE